MVKTFDFDACRGVRFVDEQAVLVDLLPWVMCPSYPHLSNFLSKHYWHDPDVLANLDEGDTGGPSSNSLIFFRNSDFGVKKWELRLVRRFVGRDIRRSFDDRLLLVS